MKNIKIICALLLVLTVAGCRQQEEKLEEVSKGNKTAVPAPDKEGVERAVLRLNRAIVERDSLVLSELTAEGLTYGHSSGLVQDRATFIDDVVNGAFDFSVIDNPDQRISISGDVAVVRHVFRASATNDGEPVEIRIGNVQVYQFNESGKWELLTRQAFKL